MTSRPLRRLAVPAVLVALAIHPACDSGSSSGEGCRGSPLPTPSFGTGGASDVGPHGATLAGEVRTHGTSGQATFRWGGDPTLAYAFEGYGPVAPGVGLVVEGGGFSGPDATVAYHGVLSGLVPGHTYWYQAVPLSGPGDRGNLRSFTTSGAFEPSWIRTFGHAPGAPDFQGGIALLPDGGFALAAWTYSTPPWAMAFAADGAERWGERLRDPDAAAAGLREEVVALRPTTDGVFLAVRRTALVDGALQGRGGALARVRADGSLGWQRALGIEPFLAGAAPTADGGAVLATWPGLGLARLDATGRVTWAWAGDAADGLEPLLALELADGRIAAVGHVLHASGASLAIPLEVRDAAGGLAWRTALQASEADEAFAAEPTGDGGLAVAGATWAGGLREPLLLRVGADGAVAWAVRLVGEQGPATGLSPAAGGGWLVAGTGNDPTPHAWVAKLDAQGALAWAVRFQGPFMVWEALVARAVPLADGRLAVVAAVETGYQDADVCVLLLDPDRRAGGAGEDVPLEAAPVTLAALPVDWTETVAPGPQVSAGGLAAAREDALTALQLAP